MGVTATTNTSHYEDIADAIRYSKEGIQYESDLVAAKAEIAEDNSYFADISTALQGKTGQAQPYDKDDMASAISTDLVYPTGTINITSNGDYDVSIKQTAHVDVTTRPPTLQSKTVTPTATQQTVQPDSGYDGLSQVTVLAALLGLDPSTLSDVELGVDNEGFYYTDVAGGGTEVYVGVDLEGIYVTDGGGANA